MDVGQRGRIRRFWRHSEIKRHHDHAILSERLIDIVADIVAVMTISPDPSSTMKFNHDREWSRALGPEDTRQQGCFAVLKIFHVRGFDIVRLHASSHQRLFFSLR